MLSHQVSLDGCLLPGVRLFSAAKAFALFIGEASAPTDGESFLAKESATKDGESLLSWLFLSRKKFTGFVNELVHGHLRRKKMQMVAIFKFKIVYQMYT